MTTVQLQQRGVAAGITREQMARLTLHAVLDSLGWKALWPNMIPFIVTAQAAAESLNVWLGQAGWPTNQANRLPTIIGPDGTPPVRNMTRWESYQGVQAETAFVDNLVTLFRSKLYRFLAMEFGDTMGVRTESKQITSGITAETLADAHTKAQLRLPDAEQIELEKFNSVLPMEEAIQLAADAGTLQALQKAGCTFTTHDSNPVVDQVSAKVVAIVMSPGTDIRLRRAIIRGVRQAGGSDCGALLRAVSKAARKLPGKWIMDNFVDVDVIDKVQAKLIMDEVCKFDPATISGLTASEKEISPYKCLLILRKVTARSGARSMVTQDALEAWAPHVESLLTMIVPDAVQGFATTLAATASYWEACGISPLTMIYRVKKALYFWCISMQQWLEATSDTAPPPLRSTLAFNATQILGIDQSTPEGQRLFARYDAFIERQKIATPGSDHPGRSMLERMASLESKVTPKKIANLQADFPANHQHDRAHLPIPLEYVEQLHARRSPHKRPHQSPRTTRSQRDSPARSRHTPPAAATKKRAGVLAVKTHSAVQFHGAAPKAKSRSRSRSTSPFSATSRSRSRSRSPSVGDENQSQLSLQSAARSGSPYPSDDGSSDDDHQRSYGHRRRQGPSHDAQHASAGRQGGGGAGGGTCIDSIRWPPKFSHEVFELYNTHQRTCIATIIGDIPGYHAWRRLCGNIGNSEHGCTSFEHPGERFQLRTNKALVRAGTLPPIFPSTTRTMRSQLHVLLRKYSITYDPQKMPRR